MPLDVRPNRRLEPVDFLRGAVMIVMALDHVRDFFGAAGNPTDLSTTDAATFMTRWVTHVCAPVFFLLTGTGAALAARGTDRARLSRFLLLRGLWLIALEILVVRWVMQFNVDYRVTVMTVFWAVGWSLIVLAMLVHLPTAVVTAIGVVMIASHNLLDSVRPVSFGSLAPLWTFLHSPGLLVSDPRHLVLASYPLVPWAGVTAVGYGLGRVYDWEASRRRLFLRRLGIASIALFVVLRAINVYGDPSVWAPRESAAFTVLSFLNTTKYPPSLLFLLMTLGPALCALAAVDRSLARWLRPATVFGRVPLFYFVLHLFFIHLLAVVVCYAQYGEVHWMFESPGFDRFPFTRPPGWGFGLPAVYLVWAIVVASLYPLCAWFARVKQRRSDWWLRFV